jgi:hypothetical protein
MFGLIGLGGPFDSVKRDADLWRLMKNPSGTDVISTNPDIGGYLKSAIMNRTPLVLTGDKLLARSVREAGCPAVCWPTSEATEDFIESTAAVAPYFDGVYFMMGDQSVFTLQPYQLSRAVNLKRRLNERPIIGLSYLRLPVTPVTLAASMDQLLLTGRNYGDTGDDAVSCIRELLPQLTALPDLEISLARLAARSKPKISKRIVSEILPRAGLDAHRFGKHLRAEKAAIEHAALDRKVQSALCA